MPQSVATELDFWMESQTDTCAEAFIFPSRKGTPLSANNFLKRVLKRAGECARKELKASSEKIPEGFLENLTHQALRRSCATHMQHLGSAKDIQAHLRHARPNITAEVYMQEIPATVRAAVESLDQKLTSVRPKVSGAIEHKFPGRSVPMPAKLLSGGAPGQIRTADLLVRSQTLYPTELRALAKKPNSPLTVTNAGPFPQPSREILTRLFTI